MKLKSTIAVLFIAILLAACGNPMPSAVPTVTENPVILPTATNTPVTYPAPIIGTPVPTTSIYPAPGTPGTGTPSIPPSGYEPQPGDTGLQRDKVSLELATSKLVVTASEPVQVKAILTGNMPDPCHHLRVVVTPADTSNTITIEVYSLMDPNTACVTQLDPFTATIPLGSYSSGDYTVMVNGEKLGGYTTVFTPQPGDANLTKGDATLDMNATKLVVSDTRPVEASANLKGTLSDPCHQLRVELTPPDAQNKISLKVYSVFDSSKGCITVIQPFQVIFPMGSFPSGHYTVEVNGELLGEFDG